MTEYTHYKLPESNHKTLMGFLSFPAKGGTITAWNSAHTVYQFKQSFQCFRCNFNLHHFFSSKKRLKIWAHCKYEKYWKRLSSRGSWRTVEQRAAVESHLQSRHSCCSVWSSVLV